MTRQPYDHIALFKQVLRVEQVIDVHTQVEEFGFTLEGRALLWFQILEPSVMVSLSALEKYFIATFSKNGN